MVARDPVSIAVAGSAGRARAPKGLGLTAAIVGVVLVACSDAIAPIGSPIASGRATAVPTASVPAARSAEPSSRPIATPPAPAISMTVSSHSDGSGSSATATVRAATVPGATCTIGATLADGSGSEHGLAPQTANSAGDATWSWTVSARGSWLVEVSCGGPSATARFSAQ